MRQLLFKLAIFLSCISNLGASTQIMPLTEIKPGMKGIGKTVFSGTTIEKFDVEVIDIVKNFSPQLDIILIRLFGPRVEHTGVVSGMSGSPIYIDNKLIGALAYSFGIFQKEPIAGVTPIEYMFEIENKEKVREKERNYTIKSNQELIKVLTSTSNQKIDLLSYFSKTIVRWNDNPYQLKPIAMPFVFGGISPNVLTKISPTLEQLGFIVTQGGTFSSNQLQSNDSLKPGDAVSGVIISGDYSISATGTVTYCDGNKILAFGHSFFNSGPINMPMATAKILTTMSNLMQSRKFSSTGKIIGNIRQDRISGIMGVIGEQSPMFPVDVEYISPFNTKKNYHYMVANDQTLSSIVPVFLWVTLLSTIESARFSNGDYSIKLDGRFMLKDHPDVALENFYTSAKFSDPPGSGKDILAAAYDVVMTFMPLIVNDYKYPNIEKIELTFHAIPGKKSVRIQNVWYDKTEIKPGDNLSLNIKLRAYQGNTMNIKKVISIPQNIVSKRLIISVGSADYITSWEKNIAAGKFRPQNFNELIQLLNNRRKNNILYIQIKILDKGAFISGKELPNLPPTILNILKTKKTSGIFKNLSESVLKEYKIPMEYQIFGGKSIQIKINNNKSSKN